MLTFDSKGFLTPDRNLTSTLEEFQDEFVSKFPLQAKRQELFNEFLRFLRDFFEAIGVEEIMIWANGSFVSNKESPNDIDFVFFLDSDLADKFSDKISQQFTHPESKTIYQMDAFLLRNYAETHPNHFFTQSDKAYWFELFSRTRKNRQGNSDKKGFVELKIRRYEI